jgi:hypothetical protein
VIEVAIGPGCVAAACVGGTGVEVAAGAAGWQAASMRLATANDMMVQYKGFKLLRASVSIFPPVCYYLVSLNVRTSVVKGYRNRYAEQANLDFQSVFFEIRLQFSTISAKIT